MSEHLAPEDREFLRQMYRHLRVIRARQAARRAANHAGPVEDATDGGGGA